MKAGVCISAGTIRACWRSRAIPCYRDPESAGSVGTRCRSHTLMRRRSSAGALPGVRIAARRLPCPSGRILMTINSGATNVEPSMVPASVFPFLNVNSHRDPSCRRSPVTASPESCNASRHRWNTRLAAMPVAASAGIHHPGRNRTAQAIAPPCAARSAPASSGEAAIRSRKGEARMGLADL